MGHSAISAAFGAALSNAVPDDKTRERLHSHVNKAGWAGIYGGIHYVFDIEEGDAVGERAAAGAAAGKLEQVRGV